MLHDVYKPNRHWKDIELWKDVTEEQWNDWVLAINEYDQNVR